MPEETHASSGLLAAVLEAIEVVSVAVEVLAIGIIVAGIVMGTLHYWRRSLARPPVPGRYGAYKARMTRALLLGLEILVAADVIRTVALEPTIQAVASLGLLVLVRTFLSWTLVVEEEGRWPWQPRGPGEGEPALPTPRAAGAAGARPAPA
jgi:uncharacterized membrane protein